MIITLVVVVASATGIGISTIVHNQLKPIPSTIPTPAQIIQKNIITSPSPSPAISSIPDDWLTTTNETHGIQIRHPSGIVLFESEGETISELHGGTVIYTLRLESKLDNLEDIKEFGSYNIKIRVIKKVDKDIKDIAENYAELYSAIVVDNEYNIEIINIDSIETYKISYLKLPEYNYITSTKPKALIFIESAAQILYNTDNNLQLIDLIVSSIRFLD